MRSIVPLALWAGSALGLALPANSQQNCLTLRFSTTSSGAEGNGHSRYPSLSDDNRWIAFESQADDLVPGDTNGSTDVFLKDVQTGALSLVSRGLGGLPADGPSYHATISGDSLWIVFESEATNLVVGDTNGVRDVFLYSRLAETITRVSVSSGGVQGNGQSGQGGLLKGSDISHDGNRIVFQSVASNLVPGDTNTAADIFVLDRPTNSLLRVNINSSGHQANAPSQDPAISADGTRVAYTTGASNLFTPDTNGEYDILVVQVGTHNVYRASQDSVGSQANSHSARPALSADGRIVAFESHATNLVPGDTNGTADTFVHDSATGITERVSVGWLGQEASNYAYRPSISGDGLRVAFTSAAGNLVPGGNTMQSVYVRDRGLGTTERWGQGSDGQNGFAGSDDPFLTGAGDRVVFTSLAPLVPQDTNGRQDIYLRFCAPTGMTVCHGTALTCPCANAGPAGGCLNSTGFGGLLVGSGTTSVFADTVTLEISGLPPSTPLLFFQGASGFSPGVPFGDGLLCAGGSVVRLGARISSPLGTASLGSAVPADPPVSVLGNIPPLGGVRIYQGWYRDNAPFCTPEGFNLTNALVVPWFP